MKTELFDFDLPDSVIAHYPANPRDSARMLHIQCDNVLDDRHVRDLVDVLDKNDVLVMNDTKVIPARLFGKRDDVLIEIVLHKHISLLTWDVFAKPAKRLKVGQDVWFGASDNKSAFHATVINKHEDGQLRLSFSCSEGDFWPLLHAHGIMPLPPYIAREKAGDTSDISRYQTVYADKPGAVAAPTAGLHFTDALLAELDKRGIEQHYVTLHVGGGTFLPVKVDDTKDHIMHSEYGELSADTASLLNAAKASGKRIVSVGTTSMRILESACDEHGTLHPMHAETDIFITPGYRFRAVDRLLTNFHLPKSTLFMLVSAFSGLDVMQRAYRYAINNHYRFYSYGDACLLERCH